MDTSRLIKLIAAVAVVFIVWKYVLPWAKSTVARVGKDGRLLTESCVTAAQHASEVWGSGLHRFANPPYDVGAWSSFRSDVDTQIAAAESECRASSASCDAARTAMTDLRSLVSDLDTSIRNGSPPPDSAVQRQEAIDNKIDSAADLARSGK